MSTPLFTPFRGEHFAEPASLARRLAPPYDVLNPAQRAALAAQDDANIVRLDLPLAPDGGDIYAEAARLLADWRARGVLVREREPAAYVLRTTTRFEDGSTRARTGAFLALAAEPYAAGRVKPHEKTHAGPKEDRRRLTHATAANLSPIFVLAPDADGALARLLAQVTSRAPWAAGDAIGAKHEMWIVTGAEAEAVAASAGAAPVYIADGHHRYETAVVIRDEAPQAWQEGARRTLAHVVSFKDDGLQILPTHRIVAGKPVAREALLAQTGRYFQVVTSGPAPLTVVLHGGAEVKLALAPGAPVGELPGAASGRTLPPWLCDDVLIRTAAKALVGDTQHFRYTASAAEARAAAEEPNVAFVVMLEPTSLADMKAVSDKGEVMPQKSTYFAPKVPTGAVIRPLD